jgi:predicted Zn-dependent protease
MILLHENLDKEVIEISKTLSEVYGFNSQIINKNLDGLFTPIPKFDGFKSELTAEKLESVSTEFNGKAVLILTKRDLYSKEDDRNEDWVFGVNHIEPYAHISVVSNARIKRYDNQLSQEIEVPFDLYIKRLKALSIHEIGHDVVKANHYREAFWVNTYKKDYKPLPLEKHCIDNSCVMYATVDIKAPSKEEGYMRLGSEKKYDAGLDDVLERIYPKWFCGKCLEAILIDEKYK